MDDASDPGALEALPAHPSARVRVVLPSFAAQGDDVKNVSVPRALEPIESTAVCQIDPIAIAAESWATSYVRRKLARVLFVALEVPPGARSVGDRIVAAVRLWSPGPDEEQFSLAQPRRAGLGMRSAGDHATTDGSAY